MAILEFVLPSVNEGLGSVLLEAVHAHCAIVASDVGDIGEVIIDHRTCRLVQSNLAESFVDAIKDIMENPDKTQKMKSNAQQHVDQNFSLRKVINKTAKHYRDLTKNID